jgi:hypothetical protein
VKVVSGNKLLQDDFLEATHFSTQVPSLIEFVLEEQQKFTSTRNGVF